MTDNDFQQQAEAEWHQLQAQVRSAPSVVSGSRWQTWREENGYWVPIGSLRPGYCADPPPFEPLPGERLSAPGFEAACWRGKVLTEPIDVVIPLGRGSQHDNDELRYCLRSIEKHLENLGRVWIVGERPEWLAVDGEQLVHLAVPDISSIADVSMLHKIGKAAAHARPRLSDKFVHFADDLLLLRPVHWEQFGPYHFGDLATQTNWPGVWRQRMKHTRDYLAAHGKTTLNGDGHPPMPFERDKFLRVLAETEWRRPPGLCVGPLYLNWTGATMRPIGDRHAIIPAGLSVAEIRRRSAGRWFLNHQHRAFTRDFRTLLDELFPRKCRFERQSVFRVGPLRPTLSIVIPTISRPTLKQTLASIRHQELADGDEILVVQDGPTDETTRRVFAESDLPGQYLATGTRARDFGGTPRNYGMGFARGEYLAAMDDDDVYVDGAFAAIREAAARCPGRPLMFRISGPTREKRIWHQKTVRAGNVGTTMFVTPNIPGRLGRWGRHRGQDFEFVYSTLAKWPPGSLVWCPDVIALYLRSSFTAAMIYASPVVRNLLYHVYPAANNTEWRKNVAMLRSYWSVFTGRKLVGVVTDHTTSPIDEVRTAFADASIEWLLAPNDPVRGESVTFAEGVRRLRSLDPDEITFYAHAKGVSPKFFNGEKPPHWLANARRWRNFMYDQCLHDPPRIDRLLRDFSCCGAMRTRGECYPAKNDRIVSEWHFSGSYFWFNHARYFEHPLAGMLGENRFAVERHPGQLFSLPESFCLAGDNWPGDTSPYNLTETDWDALEQRSSG